MAVIMIVSVSVTGSVSSRRAPLLMPVLIIRVALRLKHRLLSISEALSDDAELVRLVVHFVFAAFLDMVSCTNGAINFQSFCRVVTFNLIWVVCLSLLSGGAIFSKELFFHLFI